MPRCRRRSSIDAQWRTCSARRLHGGYEVGGRAGRRHSTPSTDRSPGCIGAGPHEIARFETCDGGVERRVLVGADEGGAAHPRARSRVRREHGRLPPRRRGVRASSSSGCRATSPGRCRSAAMAERVRRRRRGAGVAHPRADQRRSREPGGRDRRPDPCGRCAVPASTRASRSASSTSTWRRSVATSCRPRAASTCADRAAPASSTSASRSSTGRALAARSSRCRPRGESTGTSSLPGRAAGSSTGSTTTPPGSGSVRRVEHALGWGTDRIEATVDGSVRRSCGSVLVEAGFACTTRVSSSAASSRSRQRPAGRADRRGSVAEL